MYSKFLTLGFPLIKRILLTNIIEEVPECATEIFPFSLFYPCTSSSPRDGFVAVDTNMQFDFFDRMVLRTP